MHHLRPVPNILSTRTSVGWHWTSGIGLGGAPSQGKVPKEPQRSQRSGPGITRSPVQKASPSGPAQNGRREVGLRLRCVLGVLRVLGVLCVMAGQLGRHRQRGPAPLSR